MSIGKMVSKIITTNFFTNYYFSQAIGPVMVVKPTSVKTLSLVLAAIFLALPSYQ